MLERVVISVFAGKSTREDRSDIALANKSVKEEKWNKERKRADEGFHWWYEQLWESQ
jgi:hypothetical protein